MPFAQDNPATATPAAKVVVSGIENWSSICSQSFVPMEVLSGDRFRGGLDVRDYGTFGLTHVGSSASQVVRSSRAVRSDPRDVVMFSCMLNGSALVAQAGRRALARPGDGFFVDGDRAFTIDLPDVNDMLTLRIDRKSFGMSDRSIAQLASLRIPHSSPGLGALRRHLISSFINRDGLAQPKEEQLDVTLNLVNSALHSLNYGVRSYPHLSGGALTTSAKWLMEQHCSDPDLSVDVVARRFMVTRRTLETLFSKEGSSPAAYLRSLRLQRAIHLLATDGQLTVAEVAHAAGFSDVNTFIRAFRRVHDDTPQAWRLRHRTGSMEPVRCEKSPWEWWSVSASGEAG